MAHRALSLLNLFFFMLLNSARGAPHSSQWIVEIKMRDNIRMNFNSWSFIHKSKLWGSVISIKYWKSVWGAQIFTFIHICIFLLKEKYLWGPNCSDFFNAAFYFIDVATQCNKHKIRHSSQSAVLIRLRKSKSIRQTSAKFLYFSRFCHL